MYLYVSIYICMKVEDIYIYRGSSTFMQIAMKMIISDVISDQSFD